MSRRKKNDDTAKILLFDIECTNLKADFGQMLCFGWKWYGDKGRAKVKDITEFPRRFSADPTDDKELVKFAREIMLQADILVGWFSSLFDYPFIQTRLLAHGLDPLPPIAHDDGWRIARYGLRLHSNRLASVQQFLGLEEKTPILPNTWRRAMAGHKPSIRYVVTHCRQDVDTLEQAYTKLRPFSKQPTNVNLTRDQNFLAEQKRLGKLLCPRCGSSRMIKRGQALAKTSVRQRFQCQDCGGWSTGPSTRLVVAR
jgi:predicted RNA-binding Zn-ribbon protein involved in translation (DUF1610 family)